MTATQPFTGILVMSNVKMFKYEWIWVKSKPTGYLNARRAPLRAHESVLVFYEHLTIYNPQMEVGVPYLSKHKPGDTGTNYGANKKFYSFTNKGERFPQSVVKFDSVAHPQHPTQKPVQLFRYLIKTYTNDGAVVLDNCAGSFTTAIAAIQTKRNWICIEQNADYCQIGRDRIARATLKKSAGSSDSTKPSLWKRNA